MRIVEVGIIHPDRGVARYGGKSFPVTRVPLFWPLYFFLSPVTTAAFADFGAAMKDPATRLLAVEHISVNIIAVVLATVNNAKNKKAIADAAKHKNALLFTLAALVLILSRIPWSRLFA